MKAIKKQTFYQLDPRFYKDYTGNGIGDLKGLAAKVDYFDFIGVNNIILQNLLALDKNEKTQEYKKISSELGDANDLKKIISLLEAKGKDLYIEVPIGTINESNKWFKNANDTKTIGFKNIVEFKSNIQEATKTQNFKYSKEQKGYYEIDSQTKEIPLNWKDNSVIEHFAKVVRYWNDLGVKGFVFTGFEFIGDSSKKELMNDSTLRELRKFYNTIKEVNDNITVVGKSKLIFEKTFTKGPSKVFDYFISDAFSLLGTHKKYGKDIVGNFKPSKLAKMLSNYAFKPEHIVSFGSSVSGRINSRWGNSGQWSHESAKLLSMLLLLNPSSSSIYYGDEIGSLNIGLTRLDNFQDDKLFSRKEALLKSGIKETQIMNGQILQNSINSRSLMSWDDSKNGGFSNNEKTITPVSTTYREINVKNQFTDESSPLLFTKELVRIVSNSSYKNIITNGKFSVSSLIPGVIKLTFKLNKREIRVYANLTDKVRPIKRAKVGKVVLSTKYHKVYNSLPKSLDAFEGIIISKQTDEAFKETVQLKLHKKREAEEEKKLQEKTRQIELKEAEQEKIAKINEELRIEKEKQDKKDLKKQERENAKLIAQQEKDLIKKEKEEEVARKEDEKLELIKQKEAEQAEKEKEAERTKQFEMKKAIKEEKQKQKEERRQEREIERTKQLEIKNQEKQKRDEAKALVQQEREIERTKQLEIKNQEKEELEKQKEKEVLENNIAKQMREEAKRFDIMDEEIHESERTSLTEAEIAATTQIDADQIDDFDEFLNDNIKNKK